MLSSLRFVVLCDYVWVCVYVGGVVDVVNVV